MVASHRLPRNQLERKRQGRREVKREPRRNISGKFVSHCFSVPKDRAQLTEGFDHGMSVMWQCARVTVPYEHAMRERCLAGGKGRELSVYIAFIS